MNKANQLAANIKRNARKLKRKEDKELKKLEKHFDGYCEDFCKVLFGVDWDNSITDLKVFKDYNDGWIKFCEAWNSDKHHFLKANNEAFYDKTIDNTKTNEHDKPYALGGFQQPSMCWNLPIFSV